MNKAFRHVKTLFVQGNQVRTDQNKPAFLLIKNKVCFDQYELDYLGRMKLLHVEMPYREDSPVESNTKSLWLTPKLIIIIISVKKCEHGIIDAW